MPKLVLAGFAGLAAVMASLLWLQSGHAAETDPWVPPPDTIVDVEGNKVDGFGIYFYDGSSIFPPTDSEAIAECGEYDRFRARVRCRAEVRTWYRDLGDLKRSLRYAELYGHLP